MNSQPQNGDSTVKDQWERQLDYWEGAYDQLKKELLEARETLEHWKVGHEKLFVQLEQFKQWYAALEKDRDQYKLWDEDKSAEIRRLSDQLTLWKAEHSKVVSLLRQRDAELLADRKLRAGESERILTLLKQRDEENEKILELLKQRDSENQTAKAYWEGEHGKVVALVKQWESWFESMRAERDQFQKWDEEKRARIEQMEKELRVLQGELSARNEQVRLLKERIADLFRHPFGFLKQMLAEKRRGGRSLE